MGQDDSESKERPDSLSLPTPTQVWDGPRGGFRQTPKPPTQSETARPCLPGVSNQFTSGTVLPCEDIKRSVRSRGLTETLPLSRRAPFRLRPSSSFALRVHLESGVNPVSVPGFRPPFRRSGSFRRPRDGPRDGRRRPKASQDARWSLQVPPATPVPSDRLLVSGGAAGHTPLEAYRRPPTPLLVSGP